MFDSKLVQNYFFTKPECRWRAVCVFSETKKSNQNKDIISFVPQKDVISFFYLLFGLLAFFVRYQPIGLSSQC
jgi:hypothetical protein